MKTVLVTGSSRGIGFAIAQKFLENNFRVCINSNNNIRQLNSSFKKLRARFKNNIMSIRSDVSDYSQCVYIFDEIKKNFGPVDILINNAGISYFGLFNTMHAEQWQKILKTNLESAINCSHLAIQDMIKNHSGIIINISSIWGNNGASCEVIYSVSKGGLNLFTKSLAKELAPSNIRVNAIACGMIETSMNNIFSRHEKNNIKKNIPLGYFGETQDIAELAFFLASDKSKYITGQIINSDGGWF